MASPSNLIDAMNNISLEEADEGILAVGGEEDLGQQQLFVGFDAKMCLVARFITDGHVYFMAMQQTLAALWNLEGEFLSRN